MDTRGYLALGIILITISFFVGYAAGAYMTIKSVVNIAKGFVDIDMELVERALFQYKNNIGSCFPAKNEILKNSSS